MSRADRAALSWYVAVVLVVVAAMAGAIWSSPWLQGDGAFPARWHCGQWSDLLGWSHVASDAIIWLSYLAIPLSLVGLRKEIVRLAGPYVAFGFVIFIAACGFGHALEVVTMWVPVYRLSGAWKVLTALASVATALSIGVVVKRAKDDAARVRDHVLELEANGLELRAIVNDIAPVSGPMEATQ